MGIITCVVSFISRCFHETSRDTYSSVKNEIQRQSSDESFAGTSAFGDGDTLYGSTTDEQPNESRDESDESCVESDESGVESDESWDESDESVAESDGSFDESDISEFPNNETTAGPSKVSKLRNSGSKFGQYKQGPRNNQKFARKKNSTRRNKSRKKVGHSKVQPRRKCYLVPKQREIAQCPYYWGKMDRYEADQVLADTVGGTFLLRDSEQKNYMYSVSFRKYDRILHARIESWRHLFSFDIHDPGVKSCRSVCELIEHYRNPEHIMFFEPTLTEPFNRNFVLSLKHLCRATICDYVGKYANVDKLNLPEEMIEYLKEYHYSVYESDSMPKRRNHIIFVNKLEELAQNGHSDHDLEQ